WPLESYAALVQALLARGVQVVLTGSGGARDQACIAPLRSLGAAPQLLDVSGRLDFNQLAGLLGRAALYVGPDTSVSHLAASAGVPTIAVFGPTNPQRWAPWPATVAQSDYERRSLAQVVGNVTLLQAGLPCVPCGRAGCHDHNQSHSDCLAVITPKRVVEAALSRLGPVER
ncbi:MAG TPA: glycosyltransferase family 9 protein, partial [Ramlibacter sp.]